MKGLIIINAFLRPIESVKQAERLKEEFDNLGVSVEVISNGALRYGVTENALQSDFTGYDFAIFLDKDKYFSSALTSLNVRLFNRHESIRVCDDKAETVLALAKENIPVPDTTFGALCYSNEDEIKIESAKMIGEKLGYPVIVKESYGSMGKGVYKADTEEELFAVMNTLKLKPHLFQKYLGKEKGEDTRVIVIGGKAVCAMKRKNSEDFRSNVARGGSCTPLSLEGEYIALAERVAKVLALDYCGVDILTGDDDKPYICEVNSNAFFEGIEIATGVNVAKKYAEYVINEISNK